jgi:hypothetical protein
MPDISKCKGIMCPIRDTCYRFISIPSMRQAYGSFTYDYETKSCDQYWEDEQAKAQQLADMFSAKLIDNTKK